MKIGIVGSREYLNSRKIREFIFKLKEKDNDLTIVSGGQPKGADGFAKKFALEFKIPYVEFPPKHYNWNNYCIKEAYNYGKEYKPYYFFERNTEIAEYSDIIIAFIPTGKKLEESHGTNDTCQKAKKLGKKVIVIH